MTDRFDLNLLRVLVILYHCRSVSKAAAELAMTQPATSLALGRLRQGLGDPLFVRSRSGMEPTARCSELVAAAEKALAEVNDNLLRQPSFDPPTARREFVIAMADVGELHFLPPLAAHLACFAPHCSLRSESLLTEDIESALEEGRCDLALGYAPHPERPGLHSQQLFMQSLVCLVRADHPEVTTSRISLRKFLSMSHVVVHPLGRSQQLFEDMLKEKRYQRRVQMMSTHFLAVPAIIAATNMIVTLPRSLTPYCNQFERLRMVEPPINIQPYAIKQFWHPRFHEDPAVAWLRASVAELFGSARP